MDQWTRDLLVPAAHTWVMVCSRPCPWRPVTEKVSQLWLIFLYKIFF